MDFLGDDQLYHRQLYRLLIDYSISLQAAKPDSYYVHLQRLKLVVEIEV